MTTGLSNFPSLSVNSVNSRQNTDRLLGLRNEMTDLQRQINTGKVNDSYAGLGTDALKSLNLHQTVSQLDDYSESAKDANLRLKLMDASMTSITTEMQTAASSLRTSSANTLLSTGQSFAQQTSVQAMQATIDALNTDSAGRYLFSGRATDTKPVLDYSTIINGTATAAGLRQIIAERKTADGVVTGGTGLTTSAYAAGSGTVTLASSPTAGLGLSISAATATSAVASASVAGSPATATVNFTGVPADGDKVQITLALPDGTSKLMTFTARVGTADPSIGEFQVGTDGPTTAASFKATLDNRVQNVTQTDLAAASAMKASTDFFSATPASPYVRLGAGTPTATVQWYAGDSTSTNARATAQVQVAKNRTVDLGAKANEPAFVNLMAQFGALASETFSTTVATDQDRYRALVSRATPDTSTGASTVQKVTDVQMELGVASATVMRAAERNSAQANTLKTTLSQIEDADLTKVAVTLSDLNNRLQASYQTTAMLSKLSLVNYLG